MKLPSASKLIPVSLVLIVGGLAAVDLYGCSASHDDDAELIGSVAQAITNCSTSMNLSAAWASKQCSFNGSGTACTNRFTPQRDVTGTLTIPSQTWLQCSWTGSTCELGSQLGCTPECDQSSDTSDCGSITDFIVCNAARETGGTIHKCGWFDPDGPSPLTGNCYTMGECY